MRRVDLDAYGELSRGREVLVCQTPQWLEFLRVSQRAEPIIAEVLDHGKSVGFFAGAVVRKAGLRILGSPLRGWTTGYMGFAVSNEVPIPHLLEPLRQFAFRQLGCVHVELLDRGLAAADVPGNWQHRTLHGFEIDLAQTESQLFAAMSPACRRCIRKAERVGLRIEEVSEPTGFAAEYYAQLREVFARQSLVPPYPERRVHQLVDALHSSGLLLLLRARDADGRVIAASIFPGHGPLMYFWGGASLRAGLLNRPNEAMMWHAMRYWKRQGVQRFDMGGGGAYKEKYGGTPIEVPWIRCSRGGIISTLRSGAERAVRLRQQIAGGLRSSRQ